MDEAITLAAVQERFLTHQQARGNSEGSIRHYASTFRDFDVYLEQKGIAPLVSCLKTDILEAFVVWLRGYPRKMYKGSTKRNEAGISGHMRDLKALVRWASDPDQGFITWPVKVPTPKVPTVLYTIFTQDELVRIFQSRHLTGQSEYAVRNRALFSVLLDTGIRMSEAAGLYPRHIEGKQYIRVFGKGRSERLIPFSSVTLEYLEAWLEMRPTLGITEQETLFLLNVNGLRSIMRRVEESTGVHANLHKWRHQAATMLVRKNADLHAVKRILGHQNIGTTEIYLSLSNEDLAAKHAAASPMNELATILPQQRKRRRLSS